MHPGASAASPPSASKPPSPPSAPPCGAPTPPRPLSADVPCLVVPLLSAPPSLPVGRTRPDCSARAPGSLTNSQLASTLVL
eukprot:725553-Prymnesium_polylepis.1